MAGSRGFPQRGGAGCRAGVRTLGKSARKSRHRFGVRGRVPAVRRIRLNPPATLYAPKSAFGDVTLALARLPHLPVPKSGQGEIVVAGLGSGAPGHITPDVDTALRRCDTVAGYSHYVDFIRDRIAGKPVIQNGMKGEVERCLSALEAALAGQNVCMVCSGDPGILAMAGLLYELRTREPRFRDIPIRVLPGITAATIAAASLGAPLQNGFSLVSLSDLLVPADEVRRTSAPWPNPCCRWRCTTPPGASGGICWRKRLRFSGNIGAGTSCAPTSKTRAGSRKPNGWASCPSSPPPRSTCPRSSLSAAPGPASDSGVLYEPRGYVEKYMG